MTRHRKLDFNDWFVLLLLAIIGILGVLLAASWR